MYKHLIFLTTFDISNKNFDFNDDLFLLQNLGSMETQFISLENEAFQVCSRLAIFKGAHGVMNFRTENQWSRRIGIPFDCLARVELTPKLTTWEGAKIVFCTDETTFSNWLFDLKVGSIL